MGDSCYYIETELKVGWSEARAFCQSMGGYELGDLAVFSSCDAFTVFTGYLGLNGEARAVCSYRNSCCLACR